MLGFFYGQCDVGLVRLNRKLAKRHQHKNKRDGKTDHQNCSNCCIHNDPHRFIFFDYNNSKSLANGFGKIIEPIAKIAPALKRIIIGNKL